MKGKTERKLAVGKSKRSSIGRSQTMGVGARELSETDYNQLYADGVEDLEVQYGAAVAAAVGTTTEDAARSRVAEATAPFHDLLRQIGADHDRVVYELRRRKTECEGLRARLARLGDPLSPKPGIARPLGRNDVRTDEQPVSPTKSLSEGNLRFPPDDLRPSGSAPAPLIVRFAEDLDPPWPPDVINSRPEPPAIGTSDLEENDEEDGSASITSPPSCVSLPGQLEPQGMTTKEESDTMLALSTPLGCTSERSNSKSLTIATDSSYQVHQRWHTTHISVSLGGGGGIQSRMVRASQVGAGASGENLGSEKEFVSEGSVDTRLLEGYQGFFRPLISLPTNPKRVTWDLTGAGLIVYDLVAIPLIVFDPPDTGFTDFMDWFALIFWTLNMFASITVGYLKDDRWQMDPKMILAQYLKFWFWVDIAVVAPDWAFTVAKLAVGSENSAGKSVKLLRILRLARCMRLLRLAKLKWIIASIKDRINSESVDIIFNIAKMIAALLAVNHFLACIWFSTTLFDAGPKWVDVHDFDKLSWDYKYVTSFHWAITQFTPASMHVQPQNMLERIVAITVVVFGLVGFSYLVGSITGSLAELRRMNEEAVKQFWNLRRFLKAKQVPMPLRIRIEKYLEHAVQMQKGANGSQGGLPIMKLLTEQLRNELNCAMSLPHLEIHPLFHFLSTSSAVALQRITTKAVTRKLLNRGESNFHPGELASHLSFVVAGRLEYIKMIRHDTEQFERKEQVDSGEDWITEPALWADHWMTVGECVANSVSELLEVSSAEFAEAVKRTPAVFSHVCVYAANFMEYLNKKPQDELSDICQGDLIKHEIEQMLFDDDEDDEHSAGTQSRASHMSSTSILAGLSKSATSIGLVGHSPKGIKSWD